ncbi:MAG: helix-turn-helix domain-containing protein [Bacteroidota bacterium]
MKNVDFYRPDGKKLNIEIIKYEPDDLSRNKTPDRHRHNFHSIFFILRGKSFQEVEFQDFELTENQILLIPQGSIHWEKEIENLSGYVILFKDEFFTKLQRQLLYGLLHYASALRKLLIPLGQEDRDTIKLYFDLLMKEQEQDENQNQTFILQNLMLALLNRIEGVIQNLPEINSFLIYRGPFQRFIELVDETYTDHNSLDFYASELNMTQRKLNEAVKRLTGQTASNYIIDKIMLEAKRDLCFSRQSIKEIAFKLGYESQYYFSRIFKNRTGMSPEQFRILYAE